MSTIRTDSKIKHYIDANGIVIYLLPETQDYVLIKVPYTLVFYDQLVIYSKLRNIPVIDGNFVVSRPEYPTFAKYINYMIKNFIEKDGDIYKYKGNKSTDKVEGRCREHYYSYLDIFTLTFLIDPSDEYIEEIEGEGYTMHIYNLLEKNKYILNLYMSHRHPDAENGDIICHQNRYRNESVLFCHTSTGKLNLLYCEEEFDDYGSVPKEFRADSQQFGLHYWIDSIAHNDYVFLNPDVPITKFEMLKYNDEEYSTEDFEDVTGGTGEYGDYNQPVNTLVEYVSPYVSKVGNEIHTLLVVNPDIDSEAKLREHLRNFPVSYCVSDKCSVLGF